MISKDNNNNGIKNQTSSSAADFYHFGRKNLAVETTRWHYVKFVCLSVRKEESENKKKFDLPAIACKAPPRRPPVKAPAIAPTGTGDIESDVVVVRR
jgi:hypothetical protein